MTLSIPVRNGRELLGEATFDIGTFSEPVTIGRIGHLGIDYTLAEKICPVVKIDDLDKSPAFVKIDVQGLEPEVLRGMSATIRKSMPLIMIERSSDEGECAGFLSEFGYVKRYWDGKEMIESPPPGSINVFYLPPALQTLK